LISAFVHSRRPDLPFFFAFVTFNLLAPCSMDPRTNTSQDRDNQTKAKLHRHVTSPAMDFLRVFPHPRAFVYAIADMNRLCFRTNYGVTIRVWFRNPQEKVDCYAGAQNS
jgi:hypothetical protein